MAERNVEVDHVTIWRWIQYYAPELSRRCRPELRKTNGSWRVDETYLRVAGKWTYLYRAVDSTGDTIDFLLSPTRDAGAAKRFFQKALQSANHPRPRVVNVDRNPAYPRAIEELKSTRELGRRCRCRPVRYLNNVVEQDHRAIKRRVRAMPRVPVVSLGVANDPGCRNREHDSQRTDSLAAEGRHPWSGRIHSRSIRSRNGCLRIAVQCTPRSSVPV